ncbi:MAG TPA: DUF87 domain-containing protein [Anaerolineae bacterium]|nr:DUF87 domain-containing protein [Anaerolineae bacterium]
MDPIKEKLADFYLGQEYDLKERKALDQPVTYDARDLTTHGVIVGMTGSGKTGLGVIVLEEAALDGIPAIVIDPKGDMTNLLLTFPGFEPAEFQQWVNEDDARRKGMDPAAFAAAQAASWQKGLEATGQSGERIRALKAAADFVIYTPGSSAGRPVSILDSFRAPDLSWDDDSEALRDKISGVVSALLALVKIEADPMRSREHILLSNIFETAWRSGEDIALDKIIAYIQNPPFAKLGVMPVDTFYPEKERLGLAMLLNGLMASPSFAAWTQGDPLDVSALLRTEAGKPKVSVVYIAHLSDEERQFFVTLLLEQVISWMRAQSGTTSLRALLYMDEVFGYLPPTSNPPSKQPMLTLLKQARAFGLGLVLATQNPVDLDYKALTNAGTWFIGRMQADRDKQRLLDGLEGVQTGSGTFTRSDFDRLISSLQSRVFILHSVHADRPAIMTTRWAMSYLRGPLTLAQVRQLSAQQPRPAAVAPSASVPAKAVGRPAPPLGGGVSLPATAPGGSGYSSVPPQLPSEVEQVYLPVQVEFESAVASWTQAKGVSARTREPLQGSLVYTPGLVGLATVYFSHAVSRQNWQEEAAYLLPAEGDDVDWSTGRVTLEARHLGRSPMQGALFADLPRDLGTAKKLAALQQRFEDYLFTMTSTLSYNPNLKLYSQPGETDEAFRRRCRQAAEKERDAELAKLVAGTKKKLEVLETKLEREERELAMDKDKLSGRKGEELLSGAETLIGLFAGRKKSSALSSASRRRRMTKEAKAAVQESEEAIKDLEAQIAELEEQAKQEEASLTAKWQELMNQLQEIQVRPRRSDVRLDRFALAWIPSWEVTIAGQTLALAAYEPASVE